VPEGARQAIDTNRPYKSGLQIFPDVLAFVQHIESSRDPIVGDFPQLFPGNPQQSVKAGSSFGGRSLDAMLAGCRTLDGFTEQITRIDTLAQGLDAAMPALPSVRRQRIKGPSGYALNPHKVLRGDLAHAWTRMARVTQPHGGRIARLMLCPMFAGHITQEQIEWTTAASLALAQALEASGRSCEIWSVMPIFGDYTTGLETTAAVCLKGSGVPWQTQDIALSADTAWLRRLHFRFAEMLPGLTPGYSKVDSQVWKQRTDDLARALGWENASVLLGFGTANGITDQTTAAAALRTRLAAMAAA
jgi:hypothetical protein